MQDSRDGKVLSSGVRVVIPDGEGRFGPNETLVLSLQTWQGRPLTEVNLCVVMTLTVGY